MLTLLASFFKNTAPTKPVSTIFPLCGTENIRVRVRGKSRCGYFSLMPAKVLAENNFRGFYIQLRSTNGSKGRLILIAIGAGKSEFFWNIAAYHHFPEL